MRFCTVAVELSVIGFLGGGGKPAGWVFSFGVLSAFPAVSLVDEFAEAAVAVGVMGAC